MISHSCVIKGNIENTVEKSSIDTKENDFPYMNASFLNDSLLNANFVFNRYLYTEREREGISHIIMEFRCWTRDKRTTGDTERKNIITHIVH